MCIFSRSLIASSAETFSSPAARCTASPPQKRPRIAVLCQSSSAPRLCGSCSGVSIARVPYVPRSVSDPNIPSLYRVRYFFSSSVKFLASSRHWEGLRTASGQAPSSASCIVRTSVRNPSGVRYRDPCISPQFPIRIPCTT